MPLRKAHIVPLVTAVTALGLFATPSQAQPSGDIYATFAPKKDRIDHRIEYSIWTEALRNFVISMGPPLRRTPPSKANTLGTRRHRFDARRSHVGSVLWSRLCDT